MIRVHFFMRAISPALGLVLTLFTAQHVLGQSGWIVSSLESPQSSAKLAGKCDSFLYTRRSVPRDQQMGVKNRA